MNEDSLKLTAYFGERDRTEHAFAADVLLDVFEQHAFRAGVLLRGAEGFGIKHRLQTQRLLTLSEDLPIVAVGVDTRERVEAAVPQVAELMRHGLVTLERARMLTGRTGRTELPAESSEATKLTVYCGRQERILGRPAQLAVVEVLQRHGVAGATVFLGVDGMVHGLRRRARFFSRNADVPLMIVSVGAGDAIAGAVAALGGLLHRPLFTLERVRVCKRDGQRLAEPGPVPEGRSGLATWQKLVVYASEQARCGRHPLHVALIRRLRAAGAAGATALRGVWGYHGDHAPHGDRALSLRRHVPVTTIVVDRPERIPGLWAIVDEVTAQEGLVTSELVPAFRARTPGSEHGGLALADIGGVS